MLNCIFINARSILNNLKLSELQLYANEQKLDIIGVAETWLNDNVDSSEVSLDGFTTYRKDRSEVKVGRGGGVLLYVRSTLVSTPCAELNQYKAEAVWCCISFGKANKIIVGVCYRPPSCPELESSELFSVIRKASENQVLIVGDFNFPKIEWESLDSDNDGRQFLDLVLDCFLFQHVDTPTRANNILDLVFTSEEGMVEDVKVAEHLSNSDHNIISFSLKCKTVINTCTKSIPNFKKADFVSLKQSINSINWNSEFKDLDVENIWVKFCNILNDAVTKYVPYSKKKSDKNPKWMTKKALKFRNYKSVMWKRSQASGSYSDYVEYKITLNKATKEMRKAKKNFEKRLAKNIKLDPKSFYSYTRSKSKTKDSIGPLKSEAGELVQNDIDKCSVLNKYFGSVFTVEGDCNNLPEVEQIYKDDPNNILTDLDITTDIVLGQLRKLKPSKAPGIDGLSARVLLEIADEIAEPICLLYKKSLLDGIVPLDWKKANVTAIFKKGSKQDPGNYRPVSLTVQICKIFESIIRDAIVTFLKSNNLIRDSQHGFSKNRSCLTNLLTFLDKISCYVDKGVPVDVIYLDFKKAFDKVPHHRLLQKLQAHGVGGPIATWIKNWLLNRQQRVVINGVNSDWSEVVSGVPQGSVLGPLLFVVYINDLESGLINEVLKFADDSKLFGAVSSPEDVDKIRQDLLKLSNWSDEWLMVFNEAKCKVMHLGHNNPRALYSINGYSLEETSEERDLGIVVQNNLKVSAQCSKVVKTANKILGMVKRHFTTRDKITVLNLYKTLIRPHLEFCVQAWRPSLVKDIELLEGVQRRATKIIQNYDRLSYEERLQRLDLTTLETRRLRGDMIEVFKILNNFEDVDYTQFFNLSCTNLRGHPMKLFKNRFCTNIGKFTFANRVVDKWNSLPMDVVSVKTLDMFKSKLDQLIKNGWGFI